MTEDPLAPSRGCLIALVAAVAFWVAVGLVWVVLIVWVGR